MEFIKRLEINKTAHVIVNSGKLTSICSDSYVNLYSSETGELVKQIKNVQYSCWTEIINDDKILIKSRTGEYKIFNFLKNDMDPIIIKKSLSFSQDSRFYISSNKKFLIDIIYNLYGGNLCFWDLSTLKKSSFSLLPDYQFFIEYYKYFDAIDYGIIIINYALDKTNEFRSKILYKFNLEQGITSKIPIVSSINTILCSYYCFETLYLIYIKSIGGIPYIMEYNTDKHCERKITTSSRESGYLNHIKISRNNNLLLACYSNRTELIDIVSGTIINTFYLPDNLYADFYDNGLGVVLGTANMGYCMDIIE